MPTKKPIGSAAIEFTKLLMPNRLDRQGIARTFWILYRKARYGGMNSRQMWLKRFDPRLRDLSTLPIGLFETKSFILPRRYLPKTKEELACFCRRLIDRGEDKAHIEVMLRRWPEGWTLDRHVDELWSIRNVNRMLFEDIVRGREGRALCRLSSLATVGELPVQRVRRLIARQLQLWCAEDVQMVTARARVSFIAPLGWLLSSTMKVVKAGTVLRLMERALTLMEIALNDFLVDHQGDGGAKPKGKEAKIIHHYAKKHIEANHKTVGAYQTEFDDSVPYLRSHIDQFRELLDFYRTYMTERIPLHDKKGKVRRRDNILRHFHPMWYSNLSPAAGMAVALFRYAIAEETLEAMVEQAAKPGRQSNRTIKAVNALPALAGRRSNRPIKAVDPLPALPTDPARLAAITDRVLDLAYSARRVHLRDVDRMSRTRPSRAELVAMFDKDEVHRERDSLDLAGLTFVQDALAFLQEMGQRKRDALAARHQHDERHFTYWQMDLVPEHRLAI